MTNAITIRKRLERLVKDAQRSGYVFVVNSEHLGVTIVTVEEYEAADDLRKLEGERVELPTCGCPITNQYA
jgi:hypothetical protein